MNIFTFWTYWKAEPRNLNDFWGSPGWTDMLVSLSIPSMQSQFASLKNTAALLFFLCLFQSTLDKMGFLAEQGEQKSTEQPTG